MTIRNSRLRYVIAAFVALGLVVATMPALAAPVFTVQGVVAEPDGTPASGLTVTLENTSRPTVEANSSTSSENGQFSIPLLSFLGDAALPGDVMVLVASENGTLRGRAVYVVTEDDESVFGATVDLILSGVLVQFADATIDGDGNATSTISATVTDDEGNLVLDDTLTASVTAGTLTVEFAHVGEGVYEATYQAPVSSEDIAGVALTVTSTVLEGDEGFAQISVIGVPSDIVVTFGDATLTADGVSSSEVTITMERNGVPVTDEVVTLASAQGETGDVTNNGDATYSATFTAGTVSATATVTATATVSGDKGAGQITLNPGPASAIASITATPNTIQGDGISTASVSATVTDEFGNAVPGVEGVAAAIVDGIGSVGDVSDAGDGVYSAVYTSDLVTEDGSATVSISVGDISADVTITLTPEPEAEAIFMTIVGSVYREGGEVPVPNDLTVTLTNTTRGLTDTSLTGDAGPGAYTVTFQGFITNSVVASSGDVVQVSVADAEGAIRGTAERRLLAADVEANAAEIDIVTDIPVTNPVVAVTGVVTYIDGITPVLDKEGVEVDITLNGIDPTQLVGEAGVGAFSTAFVSLVEPHATGEIVEVVARVGEDVIGSVSRPVTSSEVFNGAVNVGLIGTNLLASSEIFSITGTVFAGPGVTIPAAGSTVRVSNVSRPTPTAQVGEIGEAGADAYSVVFFDLGRAVIASQEVLLIEVVDPAGNIVGSRDVFVGTASVIAGGTIADVTLTGERILLSEGSQSLALGADGSASLTITGQLIDRDGVATGTLLSFSPAALFSEPIAGEDGQFTSTFSTLYSRDGILGPVAITITGGAVTRGLTFTMVDDLPPSVEITPPFVSVRAGASVTLTAAAVDNTEVRSFSWDTDGDGVTDATGETVTRTFGALGEFPISVTVRDVVGLTGDATTTVNVTTVTVGGLAIDVPNYIKILQQVLATATDAPDLDEETKALIQALLPQLIRDGSLLGIAVPIFPASLDTEPTQPVLVEDPSGLDLENFGNPLFIPLLDAAAENPTGILDDTLRLPLSVVGSKLTLYVRTPGASQVAVNLLSQTGVAATADAVDVSATGSFDYPFVIDEELLLLVLPAWPGSDTNPLSSVTLYVATNDRNGPYSSVPMDMTVLNVDGRPKRVWRTIEMLDASTTYYYYYEVGFSYPLPTASGELVSSYALPDMRNLQFEDRGFPNSTDPELRAPLLDTIALKLQPILGSVIGAVEIEAVRLAEAALINDPALQQQILDDPEVLAIIERRLNDPQVQNALLADPTVANTIQQRISSDASLQQDLLNDQEVLDALLAQPAVQAELANIESDIEAQLADDPRVTSAFQTTLAQTGSVAQAEAAALAVIEEIAPPLIEARLNDALPGLLAQVAGNILPVAGPKILPRIAPDIGPVIAPIVLPFIEAEIQPIIIAKFGPQFLNQALTTVVGDPAGIVGLIQAELEAFTAKVGDEIARTGTVPIVSKFTVPSQNGLWVASFDMEGVADGDYLVEVQIDGGTLFANAKPITIDRSAGDVGEIGISANPGAAFYENDEAVIVATGAEPTGTLDLATTIDGDAIGAIFQLLGVEDDPDLQAQRIWVPVNQTAILLATGLIEAQGGAPIENLYDTALLAVVVSDPELIASLRDLDPEGVAAFIAGFEQLPQAKQDEIRFTAGLVRQLVLEGDFAAATSLLSANFATLQEYGSLVSNLSTIPSIPGDEGSVRMLIPPLGRYWLRAVAVDQFGNMTTENVPIRIDVVAPDADVFRIASLSIGDQNGNGSSDDPFETISIGEDGVVDPGDFRIWGNTTALDVTVTPTMRTEHPLDSLVLQVSDDGQTWTDAVTASAEQLLDLGAGSSLTLTYDLDVAASLDAGVGEISLRVRAVNRLSLVGIGVSTALTVDEIPLAIDPALVALDAAAADGFTPNPDSGGLRDTVEVTAQTPSHTSPAIAAVQFEISTDGSSYSLLDASIGGPESGLVSETSVEGAERGARAWIASWDTTQVDDTIVNIGPEARDASQDDNPYLVRVLLLADDGSTLLTSDAIAVPIDNVDDVPPISGSSITLLEREGFVPGTFEIVEGDPLVLRALARVTVELRADLNFATVLGGQVILAEVDAAGGLVGEPIAAADVVDGQFAYTFAYDTTALDNRAYRLAALAVDASGNAELSVDDTVVTVEIRNIVIGRIRITRTGDFAATDRALATPAADRPVGGVATFSVEAKNAAVGEMVVSADATDLAGDVLQLLALDDLPSAEGVFDFSLDTTAFPDGVIYVRFAFGASPNVVIPDGPIAVLIDNTAPTLTIRAPTPGARVGVRPILWAEYADASGIALSQIVLRDPDAVVFDVTAGDVDTRIVDLEPSPGLNLTAVRLVYSTPNDGRLNSGPHLMEITVHDLAGNGTSASTGMTVEHDTHAPIVQSFSPTGTTRRLQPAISVAFSDDLSGVALDGVSIRVSDAGGVAVGGALDLLNAAGESVPATLSGSASFVPDQPLALGEYHANANIADADGNSAPVAWQFIVEGDDQKPNITAVSPTGTIKTDAITLVVSFTDDSAVDAIFTIDGINLGQGQIANDSRARTVVSGLQPGTHTVIAALTDEHGNTSTVEYTFTVEVDTDAPAIASISPVGTVRSKTVTIVVAFTDASPVTSTFSVDGGAAQAGEIADGSRARFVARSLDQGDHSVVVVLRDARGNATTTEFTFLVEIDVVPPSIAGLSPSGFVGSLRPLVSATYSDNLSGVDAGSVVIKVDDRAVTPQTRDASHVMYRPGNDLEPGEHTVSIDVSDGMDNTATAEWAFTIETTPPRITTVVPTPGATVGGRVERRAQIVVSAFYGDSQSGVDAPSVAVVVMNEGVEVSGTVLSQTETAVSWKAASPLAAGVYTIDLAVADNVGNSTEYSWSFIVEDEVAVNLPPRIVPNPFANDVSVWIGLGREAAVAVRVYDFNQRLIASRNSEIMLPGLRKIDLALEMAEFARGIYICQIVIDSGDQKRVVKILKMAKVR